jgi:hypothetical protein
VKTVVGGNAEREGVGAKRYRLIKAVRVYILI